MVQKNESEIEVAQRFVTRLRGKLAQAEEEDAKKRRIHGKIGEALETGSKALTAFFCPV